MPPQPQPPVITPRRPRSCRTLDAYTSLVLVWVVGIGGTWGYELGRCSGEFWEAALVNQYYAGHYGRAIRSAAVAGATAAGTGTMTCASESWSRGFRLTPVTRLSPVGRENAPPGRALYRMR